MNKGIGIATLSVLVGISAQTVFAGPISSGSAAKAPAPIVKSVSTEDSELGETGLQGVELKRYAEWLSSYRQQHAPVLATKPVPGKMYFHKAPAKK